MRDAVRGALQIVLLWAVLFLVAFAIFSGKRPGDLSAGAAWCEDGTPAPR